MFDFGVDFGVYSNQVKSYKVLTDFIAPSTEKRFLTV